MVTRSSQLIYAQVIGVEIQALFCNTTVLYHIIQVILMYEVKQQNLFLNGPRLLAVDFNNMPRI